MNFPEENKAMSKYIQLMGLTEIYEIMTWCEENNLSLGLDNQAFIDALLLCDRSELKDFIDKVGQRKQQGLSVEHENDFKGLLPHSVFQQHAKEPIEGERQEINLLTQNIDLWDEEYNLNLTVDEKKAFYQSAVASEQLFKGLELLLRKKIAGFEQFREPLFLMPSNALEIAKAVAYLFDKEVLMGPYYAARLAHEAHVIPLAEAFKIVAEEREQKDRVAQILAGAFSSYSSNPVRTLLQRYGTENLGSRADKEFINQKIAEVCDFHRKHEGHIDWMKDIAQRHISACVNQPVYGQMMLEAGMFLAEAKNESQKKSAAQYLFILFEARVLIEKNQSIKGSLKAEATNMLVHQCAKILDKCGELSLDLENDLANESCLSQENLADIEKEALALAGIVMLWDSSKLKDFFIHDQTVELRDIFAGAVFSDMVGEIQEPFKKRREILEQCYLTLDDNQELNEDLMPENQAQIFSEIKGQGRPIDEQKAYIYEQMKMNDINMQQSVHTKMVAEIEKFMIPVKKDSQRAIAGIYACQPSQPTRPRKIGW